MSQHHTSDDRERLIAYLYDECDDDERARLEDHLAACAECRDELDGLQAVRSRLVHWAPPEREPGFSVIPRADRAPWWVAWRVPMQAAAAVLVLAMGAAVAHLDVHYGAGGLEIQTGWPAAPVAAEAAAPAALAPQLAAFESRVEQQLETRTSASSVPPADQTALLDRVRTLVSQSEQRQRREFALRLVQAMQDMEYQRRADLVRIDQNLGQIEGTTGAAVAQQRELWNYLVQVAQQRPQ